MKYLQTILMFILIAFTSAMLASELNNSRSMTVSENQFIDCGSVITTVGENIAELSGNNIQYQIRIENTGNTTNTFTIYTEDYSATGENPDGSSMENNLDFNQELLDMNLNPLNEEITLAPGETYDFIVKLSLPFGNQYDRWNCTEIKAINSSCPENEGRTVVFTYVPIPDGVIIGSIDFNTPVNNFTNLVSDLSLLA
jgi:hypothetical protein